MAIKLVLPADGDFSITSLQDLIDVVADGSLSETTSTGFTADGFLNGAPATAVATGTGLSYFFGYPVSGTMETLTVSDGTDDILFKNMNLDVAELVEAVSDDTVSEFLLGFDWNMKLGNAADIAPAGTLIDGAPFELTGDDKIKGRGGDDDLYSDGGNDKLLGGSGNDTLDGGTGNDKIEGGGGKDVLIGGEGNDVLIGGTGLDDFIFADGGGSDKVKDFNAARNGEDIDLSAVTEITGMKDLRNHHMEQVGDDVVIDDGAGLTITLLDVSIDDLGKGDFLF